MTGRERVRARIGFMRLVAGFSRPYAGLRSGARRVARSVDLVGGRAAGWRGARLVARWSGSESAHPSSVACAWCQTSFLCGRG